MKKIVSMEICQEVDVDVDCYCPDCGEPLYCIECEATTDAERPNDTWRTTQLIGLKEWEAERERRKQK